MDTINEKIAEEIMQEFSANAAPDPQRVSLATFLRAIIPQNAHAPRSYSTMALHIEFILESYNNAAQGSNYLAVRGDLVEFLNEIYPQGQQVAIGDIIAHGNVKVKTGGEGDLNHTTGMGALFPTGTHSAAE